MLSPSLEEDIIQGPGRAILEHPMGTSTLIAIGQGSGFLKTRSLSSLPCNRDISKKAIEVDARRCAMTRKRLAFNCYLEGWVETSSPDGYFITEEGFNLMKHLQDNVDFHQTVKNLRHCWCLNYYEDKLRLAPRMAQVLEVLGNHEGFGFPKSKLQLELDGQSELGGHTKRILSHNHHLFFEVDGSVHLTTLAYAIYLARQSVLE